MENEKVYGWVAKWPLVLASVLMAAIFAAVIIPESLRHGWIVLPPSIGLLIGTWYTVNRAWKTVKKTTVNLSDTGLRKTTAYGEYFAPWTELQLLKISRNRQGRVRRISAVTDHGKRVDLGGLEAMDEIAAFMESHATSKKSVVMTRPGVANPYITWPLTAVSLIGAALSFSAKSGSSTEQIGNLMIIAAVLPMVWLRRRDLEKTYGTKSARAEMRQSIKSTAMITVGVTILIILGVLVMVMMQKR